MKTIEYQQDNYTIKEMIISHRFRDYPNIICSGSKIYQLPCQVGNRSYGIKELHKKYHLGMTIYLINSKRVSTLHLKSNVYTTCEKYILEKIQNCPF